MSDKGKYIRMGYYLLVAVLVLISIIQLNQIADFDNPLESEYHYGSMGLYLAYGFALIGALLWIANYVLKLVGNFKEQLPGLIGAVILAVVVLILESQVPAFFEGMKISEDNYVTAVQSKWSSVGLYVMYLAGGLAIVAAIASGIKSIFE